MHTKGHSVFGFLDLRQVFDLQGDPSMGEQDDILAAVETKTSSRIVALNLEFLLRCRFRCCP